MNLSYNGKSFEVTINTCEAIETEEIGHVLGKTHRILRGKVARRQTPIQLQRHGMEYMA